MNRADIIRMAREAQMSPSADGMYWTATLSDLEKFAAAEREKVAEEIFDMCKEGWWDSEGMRHHWSKRGQA